jgi:hypothetical protein
LKRLSFFIVCFGCLCQISGGHSCVDSYLCGSSVPLVFMSVFVPVLCCFYYYGSVIIVWSQELWCLQCCSFCSVLPWLFEVFSASVWMLGFISQSLWWMSLEFWWGFHWTCRLLLVM